MSDAELAKATEVVRDRLYYVSLRVMPPHRTDVHLFTVDDELHYWPFFLDFGPLSSGCLYRFCMVLNAKMTDKALAGKRIYVFSGPHMHKRANAVYLLAAYTLLYLGRTPEEAFRPFQHLTPPLAPWHDASPTVDTFHLSVLDTLRGIAKARECHFFSHETFDIEEYEYYEKVENGDMNWIVEGRFLAFAGPHDVRSSSPEGYHTTAVEDLLPYFKSKGIQAVVRLNKKYYNERRFINVGIDHHDMYYLDGSNPPEAILQRFLAVAESTNGSIAVHCKAGLGRTGTCIGAYLMKHYRFTAREVIGWMRVCRPGSVIGPQQQFLEEIQPRMWAEGEAFRRVKELPMPVPGSLLHRHQVSHASADRRMVTKASSGMVARPPPVSASEYGAPGALPVSPITTPTASSTKLPAVVSASGGPAGGAPGGGSRRGIGVSTVSSWMGFGRTGSGRNLTSSSAGGSTQTTTADEREGVATGRDTPTTPLSTDSAAGAFGKAGGTTPTDSGSRTRTQSSATASGYAVASPARTRTRVASAAGETEAGYSGAAAMPSSSSSTKYRVDAVPRGSGSATMLSSSSIGGPPGGVLASQGDMLRSAKSRSPHMGLGSPPVTASSPGVLRAVGSGVVSPSMAASASRSPGFYGGADVKAPPSPSRFMFRAAR